MTNGIGGAASGAGMQQQRVHLNGVHLNESNAKSGGTQGQASSQGHRRLAAMTLGVLGLSQGVSAFVPAVGKFGNAHPAQARLQLVPQPSPRVVDVSERALTVASPRAHAFGIDSLATQPGLGRLESRLNMASQPDTERASEAEVETGEKRKVPIIRVETLENFKKEVADEKQKIVAVKFFSPTCHACKAMAPRFKQLALKYPQVKFVEVPLTQNNAMLHQGLGVPSFPFGHIYHPEAGLVEEGSINRKRIGGFEQKLVDYLEGSCNLPDDD